MSVQTFTHAFFKFRVHKLLAIITKFSCHFDQNTCLAVFVHFFMMKLYRLNSRERESYSD